METELCEVVPEDWRVRAIEDVCIRVTSGGTPSRGDASYYQNGTWSWVKTQELQDRWIDSTEELITERAVSESSAKILPHNTILIAMYGATVGQLGLLRRPMACNQACCALIVNEDIANYNFIFYQLLQVRSQLKRLATGAAQQNLSGQLIRGLRFPYPSVTEQRAIAHILGTLDDKIDLNRRMCATLEEMARALFKSWFVDFDPVRAKAAGRDTGLPKHLADLFPDRMVDSELGEIPEGWEVGRVDDEFDLTMGQSPPGSTYNEEGIGLPFYQGRTDFGFRFPARRVFCTSPTRFAKWGDTLISVRAPVGDINLATEDCAIGRGVAAARHRTGSRSYSYQFMRSQAAVFGRFEAEGTVFGSISKKDFHAITCIRPPKNIVIEFERHIAPVDDRIEVCERESIGLAALRNSLLPKLVSGEIRLIVKSVDDPKVIQ